MAVARWKNDGRKVPADNGGLVSSDERRELRTTPEIDIYQLSLSLSLSLGLTLSLLAFSTNATFSNWKNLVNMMSISTDCSSSITGKGWIVKVKDQMDTSTTLRDFVRENFGFFFDFEIVGGGLLTVG